MKVQFLVDFRGKLTRENYYTAGAVVEFDDATARALIDEGRAVALPEADPAPEPESAPAVPVKPVRKQRSTGGVL